VIFLTVGTQLPFDRLVRAADAWAGDNPTSEIFAQIGHGAYRPRHMRWAAFLPPELFRDRLSSARLVVSHAGIGNLLLALEARKPIVLMPRRADLNEHRNDHQLATVKWLPQLPGVKIVQDAAELRQALASAGWDEPPPLRNDA